MRPQETCRNQKFLVPSLTISQCVYDKKRIFIGWTQFNWIRGIFESINKYWAEISWKQIIPLSTTNKFIIYEKLIAVKTITSRKQVVLILAILIKLLMEKVIMLLYLSQNSFYRLSTIQILEAKRLLSIITYAGSHNTFYKW